MTVKTMRYEIVGWQGDPKEARLRWRTIADQCREIVNVIWQQWEVWHVAQGNDIKVQQFATELREYRQKERESRPKLEVQCMPAVLNKLIRKKITERFPGVHSRVRELLLNITAQRMTGKDVEGKWNIWVAVLLNRQGRPNSTHDQPIPFDRANTKPLSLVEGKYTNYQLKINLTRLPSDKKASPSIEDHVQLKARGSGAVIMRRIVGGEYKFCGSSIVYHQGKHKWFALVAYNDHVENVENSELDHTKKAVLHPTRKEPWALWIGSRWQWFGGRGNYVAAARHRLLTQRWSRQETYRHAGSANKGHGRLRALAPIDKLSNRWKDFCKTANHTLTSQVIDYCIDQKVGHLVYLQPCGDKRDTRFLARAGKVEGRTDSTGWDWSQVATMLAYKCKEKGIHLEVRKCDGIPKIKKEDVRSVRTVSSNDRSKAKRHHKQKAAVVS